VKVLTEAEWRGMARLVGHLPCDVP
jgi:hypothetical protein